MRLRSGREEGFPYSLSRWTDVPAAKWPWMRVALEAGRMEAFDPTTGVPSWWSLRPEDTLGLVFWTKDPSNLIANADLFTRYRVKVHVTATGWFEVEKGAPGLDEAAKLLVATAKTFGPENVTWRFSPIPVLDETSLIGRFVYLAQHAAEAGIKQVFTSFLQTNDRMQDGRSRIERLGLLATLAKAAYDNGQLEVLHCNEDDILRGVTGSPENLMYGICAPPGDWLASTVAPRQLRKEGCGCVHMVEPFTINESCTLGCLYCYAADEALSGKKRNTTRSLPVVR